MFDNNCALFQKLTPNELQTLSAHTKLKVLSKQQYLCAQHTQSNHAYSIASGAAAVERISSDGRRQVLSFIFPGDFIGLSSSEYYDFGVKSLTGLTAHQFSRQKLYSMTEDMPKLEENIKGIGGIVISRMLDQLYLLGQKKAHERLCYLFTHLLERMPGATPNHMDLPMTRLDIADYLGLTVETVSRSMTKLKQEGLISITGPHSLSILDIDEVEYLADIH